MNSSRTQGSAFVVIIVTLAIALIGALGFVFWKNATQSKDTTQSVASATTNNPVKQSDTQAAVDPNEGHLVLDDWGVKFKLPENIKEVRYYKEHVENENGLFEHYEFSTARVESLGEMCVDSNEHGSATRLAILSRSVADQADNPYRGMFVNNNQPLGGYYYYMGGAQAMCSEEGGDIQGDDRNLLLEMLKNPIAS